MLKEEPLNAYLAEIIGESHTLVADPEFTLSNGRMDVRCRVGSHIVGIEAKLGYRPAQQRAAISDANRRLVNKHCDVAVALLYPSAEFRTSQDLRAGEVRVNVRSQVFPFDDKHELARHARLARWDTIAVASLADYLEKAPEEASSPETLASLADVAIEGATEAFTPVERMAMLHAVGRSGARDPNKAVNGLMTDLMTAIMFQSKLDVTRHTIDKPSPDWNPPRVIQCLDSKNVQSALRTAHSQWLDVDYKQILEWSCAILDAMPATPSTRSALSRLARAALDIEQLSGNQYHDLFGITFCQSVESAKNDGSMYTTIPAATLLTRLVFNSIEERIDWTDYDQVTGLRIVDFACGTGTLLIAAANYILHNERTGRHDDVSRALLEQVMYGFDINNRAVFQSATGLGMISPSVTFRKMHLYSMLLGIDQETGVGRVGSLELLDGLNQGSFNPPPPGTRIDSDPSPIEVDRFDVAIMNPPFTVNYKRHHQFSDEIKQALKDRESDLSAGTAIDRSGNSGAFMVLADKHIDGEHGLLGFVLPSATINGPAGRSIRVWLSEAFHIKHLVVSYDPSRIYFSGNTNLGELLVIATRKPKSGEPPPTKAVKLTSNPATARSAVAVADYIINGSVEEHGWGSVDEVPYADIENGDWRALQFADSNLYRAAASLERDWHSTMGQQFEIKEIGRMVREHGEKLDHHQVGATPVLWNHDAKHCNKLVVKPDAWIKAKPGHENELRRHIGRLHRLKLPGRISVTSSCATAVLTEEPSLGSAWQSAVPIKQGTHTAEDIEKAAVVILNSTLGKLATLLVRNNKKPVYPAFSIAAQNSIPMPPIASLSKERIGLLVDACDRFGTDDRQPFPQAHTCEVQIQIDASVCKALDFDPELCKDLRDRLAREPMISNTPNHRGLTQDFEYDPQPALAT